MGYVSDVLTELEMNEEEDVEWLIKRKLEAVLRKSQADASLAMFGVKDGAISM